MKLIHTQLSEQLRNAGYSTTTVRVAVFDALLNQEPMTMHSLINKLQADVDRASVYRTIDLFESLDIVQRLQIGWKYKVELSDAYHEHHHHISCRDCGNVTSIKGDSHIEKAIHDLAMMYGYSSTAHQLEIQGICKNCFK